MQTKLLPLYAYRSGLEARCPQTSFGDKLSFDLPRQSRFAEIGRQGSFHPVEVSFQSLNCASLSLTGASVQLFKRHRTRALRPIGTYLPKGKR
jgi:hypothetical protein